jgi:hypothetical protein
MVRKPWQRKDVNRYDRPVTDTMKEVRIREEKESKSWIDRTIH